MTSERRTADHARPALRWSAALLVTLPAAAAVLMVSGGDVLVARDRAELASRLPGNSVMPALALLPATDKGGDRDSQREMAMTALRRAPLAGEALTWLALDAVRRGDKARSAELLALSGQTGWHDEWTQRNLYNTAMRSGDATEALRHAEALLRQGRGEAELFPRFVQGMAIPKFRAAFFKAIATTPAWGKRFLVKHGHELDQQVLLDMALVWAMPHKALQRDIAAPVMTRLVAAGRVETAAHLWTLLPEGGPAQGTYHLFWPDELARNLPTPFDWNLPQGFVIEGEESHAELTAPNALPGEAASRVVWLYRGDIVNVSPSDDWPYRGDFTISASHSDGWLWGAGCISQPVVPNRRFEPDTHFTVPPDCEGIVIAVAPAPGSQSARLGVIRLWQPLRPGDRTTI